MKKKLAIITTHPIQYNAPLFSLLKNRGNIDLHVFYTWGESVMEKKFDPGFGASIEWDIPILKGYNYTFLENIAKKKGSDHFAGINNPGIIDAILAYKPNAILIYGWAFKSHLRVLRYFKGRVPLLFRGDSTLIDGRGGIKDKCRMIFLKWVYRHIDKALYTGKNNYDYYRAAGLAEDRLVFVPHSVDNQRFGEGDQGKKGVVENIRGDMGIKTTDFVFLFSGKLEQKKSPGLLIKTFCDARFGETVHLVLVGEGPMGTELRDQYAGYSQVHFTGFVNQSRMPAFYHTADVVVLPSGGPGETWGLAINEAMACGKPVIVSDHCGCAADLVQNDSNGYIFISGNSTSLAEKMSLLYRKGKNIKEMGKVSLKIISEFSMEKAAEGIENAVLNSQSYTNQ